MNLLELQVLSMVSRIPNGSEAPSVEFGAEPEAGAPNAWPEFNDDDASHAAADDFRVKPPV